MHRSLGKLGRLVKVMDDSQHAQRAHSRESLRLISDVQPSNLDRFTRNEGDFFRSSAGKWLAISGHDSIEVPHALDGLGRPVNVLAANV